MRSYIFGIPDLRNQDLMLFLVQHDVPFLLITTPWPLCYVTCELRDNNSHLTSLGQISLSFMSLWWNSVQRVPPPGSPENSPSFDDTPKYYGTTNTNTTHSLIRAQTLQSITMSLFQLYSTTNHRPMSPLNGWANRHPDRSCTTTRILTLTMTLLAYLI